LRKKLAIPQTLCVCNRLAIIAIGGAAIRISRVVVVDIARCVRIPHIIRIVEIRRAKTH